jgi:dCTP deaminase
MILSDEDIRKRVKNQRMIAPFVEHQVRHHGKTSYGLGSFGYDARAIQEFRLFQRTHRVTVDPCDFPSDVYLSMMNDEENPVVLPPFSYALTASLESFIIPRDLMAIVIGKSTLARAGLFINTTPLEPCWEGQITLELANLSPYPLLIRPNQGICQVLFFQGYSVPSQVYGINRKYQRQVGIVLPKGG